MVGFLFSPLVIHISICSCWKATVAGKLGARVRLHSLCSCWKATVAGKLGAMVRLHSLYTYICMHSKTTCVHAAIVLFLAGQEYHTPHRPVLCNRTSYVLLVSFGEHIAKPAVHILPPPPVAALFLRPCPFVFTMLIIAFLPLHKLPDHHPKLVFVPCICWRAIHGLSWSKWARAGAREQVSKQASKQASLEPKPLHTVAYICICKHMERVLACIFDLHVQSKGLKSPRLDCQRTSLLNMCILPANFAFKQLNMCKFTCKCNIATFSKN